MLTKAQVEAALARPTIRAELRETTEKFLVETVSVLRSHIGAMLMEFGGALPCHCTQAQFEEVIGEMRTLYITFAETVASAIVSIDKELGIKAEGTLRRRFERMSVLATEDDDESGTPDIAEDFGPEEEEEEDDKGETIQ